MSKQAAPLGQGYYWQELNVGDRFITQNRTVTETDLVSFISVTGMLETIFIDITYNGAMAGRPVPAALTQAMIEGLLLQTMVQRTGLALLEMSLKTVAPVRVGDTIHAEVEVTALRQTSGGNRAVVASQMTVFNQDKLCVMTYEAVRLLAGRPESPDGAV